MTRDGIRAIASRYGFEAVAFGEYPDARVVVFVRLLRPFLPLSAALDAWDWLHAEIERERPMGIRVLPDLL